ncbi:MAG: AAA family ATPase [Caldilinea sp.]|nr:AAA family ATPase [Caldilinea sp.]MDW8439588.1 AAA family ATPase [Caldilineaceae bacterium]
MTVNATSAPHDAPERPVEGNPYIGPRPFEDTARERRLFFGRERESADLLSLVMAERLVLFYAPSGAGKSSLINARLLDGLRKEGFVILGKARVGGNLPASMRVDAIDNIYIFNLLRDLEGERADLERLASRRLPDYLRTRFPATKAPDRVLIIDQFEELFTTYADQWHKREDFFRQLNQALSDDPRLWLILSMREDAVAALDPYARLLFNRLRVRYRMNYMGHDAALEAVKKPAEAAGRSYEAGVAEKLVDNLRQMARSQETAEAPRLGEHVEPVQLQVVCMQLWEKLATRPGATITLEDVESLGRGAGLGEFVDHALASFYEQTLAAVLSVTDEISERELRDWFSHTLITRDGTRNLLYQSEHETGGIPNHVVYELERRFLVRGETRGGGRWVELVHDRLVEPILEANEAWRRNDPLILAADLWRSERSATLLLGGALLAEAQASLERNPRRYGALEREFVAASAEAEAKRLEQERLEQEKRRKEAARARVIAIAAALTALIMFALALTTAWFAWRSFASALQQQAAALSAALEAQRAWEAEKRAQLAAERAQVEAAAAEAARAEAEQLNRRIRGDQLASQAALLLTGNPQQALLLAVEAMRLGAAPNRFLSHTIEQSIYDLLNSVGGLPLPIGDDPVALALSPDAQWFALADARGAVQLWRFGQDGLEPMQLTPPGAALTWALAAAPDGKRLAAVDNGGTVRLWQTDAPDAPPIVLQTSEEALTMLAFSPEGASLAAAGADGVVYLWTLTEGKPVLRRLGRHEGGVNALAFSPRGEWLASGGADGLVQVWSPEQPGRTFPVARHEAPISALVFSLDGSRLASGDDVGGLFVFTFSDDLTPAPSGAQPLPGHMARVTAMDFSSNAAWLATGDANGVMRVWSFNNPAQSYATPAHESYLSGLAFVPGATGDRLVSVGYDGPRISSVRLWDYTNFGLAPTILRGHEAEINLLATSPAVQGFLTAGYDHSLRVWAIDDLYAQPQTLVAATGLVDALAAAPDAGRLFSIGANFSFVQVWSMDKGIALEQLSTRRESSLSAIAASRDGAIVAAGDATGWVHIWSADTAAPALSLAAHSGKVNSVALRAEEHLVATAGDDGVVQLWRFTESFKEVIENETIVVQKAPIGVVQFSPDGRQLAYAGANSVFLQRLDVGEPAPLRWMTGSAVVTALAFSPDGKLLVAGDEEGRIWLWNLEQPTRTPRRWGAHLNEINAVVFGENRARLYTVSADRTVRLWDLTSSLLTPVVLRGHTASVNDVVFVKNALVTAAADGAIRRWLLAPEDLAQRACIAIGRNFYRDEWERFFPDEPCRSTCAGLPDRCGETSP